jgi:DNA-binding IclR family transcriptional regulator
VSSLKRMLAVLDLFTAESPVWTAEGVIERLAYSRPTGYRYMRELCAAGLLRRSPGGLYVLGTRVIELDYQIRVTDPALIAGHRVMRELSEETGCDVMLASLFDDHVVTIHQEQGTEGISASYGRGRRLPLYRGMMSKTILAWLPRARLRRLYALDPKAAAKAGFARDWDALVERLKAIRADGYCVTRGELDPGLVGTGVPVVVDRGQPPGSLGVVMSKQRFSITDEARLVALLQDAATRIGAALPEAPAPNRAPAPAPRRTSRVQVRRSLAARKADPKGRGAAS